MLPLPAAQKYFKASVSSGFAPNLLPKSSAADSLPQQLEEASLLRARKSVFPSLKAEPLPALPRQLPAPTYDATKPPPHAWTYGGRSALVLNTAYSVSLLLRSCEVLFYFVFICLSLQGSKTLPRLGIRRFVPV